MINVADSNRNVNICLINTNKPTTGLPDNNRIGIDHINSFIWFQDKKERDNYMALKTVHSQIENSTQHDYNDVGSFRIKLTKKEYFASGADLVKLSHTQPNIENDYFYNIVSVDYTNNGVVQVYGNLNVIYTYFMNDVKESNQIQGVITKSNFKNQNFDIKYVNDTSKGLIGDKYGAVQYNSSLKKVAYNKPGDSDVNIAWLVISMRVKNTILNDFANSNGLINKMTNAFSDEIVMSVPFFSDTGKIIPIKLPTGDFTSGDMTISYFSYLMINGGLDVSNKGFWGKLTQSYNYLTDLPFTTASFFDIQEIGIIADFPGEYKFIVAGAKGPYIEFQNPKTIGKIISLQDLVDEKFHEAGYVTYQNLNRDITLTPVKIISNADKSSRLFDSFENWENNVIYNKYFLKYFNTYTHLNGFNLFGSSQDVQVATSYLGKDFKKLIVSTDLQLDSLDNADKLSGLSNTDFLIKYQGDVIKGEDAETSLNQTLLKSVEDVGGLIGAVAGAEAGTEGVITGSTIGRNVAQLATSPIRLFTDDLQQQGGSSGYVSDSFNASPLFWELEEFVPKIIFERNANVSIIDEHTNFYGTSCSIFTNNLKTYVKDVINNRKNHKCVIQGNFRVNYLYPQVNQQLYELLVRGIIFMKKLD